MSDHPIWRDAEYALASIQSKPADRDLLLLLTRLPLVDVWVLQQLTGLDGPASLYRRVSRLRETRLIGVIQPPIYPNHSPRLLYLTDLGLATVALDQQVDLRHLAARRHLRGHDLLALTPHLSQLLATYELLAGLAGIKREQPKLLAWERPWRRRFHRLTAKRPGTVTLPAFAALSWDDHAYTFLLLPDRGTVPLSLYRPTIDHLLAYRQVRPNAVPVLIIGTSRVEGWNTLLREACRRRQEAPLRACVADWDDLGIGLEAIESPGEQEMSKALDRSVDLQPLGPWRTARRVPRLVSDALSVSPHTRTDNALGRAALSMAPHDHTLLRQIGLHPFLPPASLATILGWEIPSVRRRLNRLVGLRLLQFLGPDEAGRDAEMEMAELTGQGLDLVAAHLGLSLATAGRALGLTGGGPDHPVGPRTKMLRTLAHTRGADEIFVGLYRTARQLANRGGDDAVMEWQNAAACSRHHLRPDGRGLYRRQGKFYDFLLEYDRGTMNARDYFKKFRAYYRYATRRDFEHDFPRYPTILVVCATNAAEDRIARVVRAIATGQQIRLPLLLTCQWRVEDPLNPYGLLGRICRESDADFDDRRSWLPASTAVLRPDPQRTMTPTTDINKTIETMIVANEPETERRTSCLIPS